MFAQRHPRADLDRRFQQVGQRWAGHRLGLDLAQLDDVAIEPGRIPPKASIAAESSRDRRLAGTTNLKRKPMLIMRSNAATMAICQYLINNST